MIYGRKSDSQTVKFDVFLPLTEFQKPYLKIFQKFFIVIWGKPSCTQSRNQLTSVKTWKRKYTKKYSPSAKRWITAKHRTTPFLLFLKFLINKSVSKNFDIELHCLKAIIVIILAITPWQKVLPHDNCYKVQISISQVIYLKIPKANSLISWGSEKDMIPFHNLFVAMELVTSLNAFCEILSLYLIEICKSTIFYIPMIMSTLSRFLFLLQILKTYCTRTCSLNNIGLRSYATFTILGE